MTPRSWCSGAGALAIVLALASGGAAQIQPVFEGDPVDGLGRAYPILPGVPLILPQPDGRYRPPIVDDGVIGDVDIVVRVGSPPIGATMPPPAIAPVAAVAGGPRLGGGAAIPFTVIASDGDPTSPAGNPLLGPELDGIPVVVLAYADLDGDGFVGPTNADPAGATDNGREMQESSFEVGRQVAIFSGGVARGTVVVDTGAPASMGGVTVVLTAVAYVGAFSPDFFFGAVPDGPGVATLLPFFPDLAPDRVVDAEGRGGPAGPEVRIGVMLEDAFDPPVGDPVLGTPFALPTNGSSPTVDRAVVYGGAPSAARFVRAAGATGLTGEEDRLELKPFGAGTLLETVTGVQVADDGPGGGVPVRLVPSDALANVTDAAPAMAAVVRARAGAAIAAPDVDGDPSVEPVSLGAGEGVVLTVDDAGGGGDQAAGGTGEVVVEIDGAPVTTLAVSFGPGTGGGPSVLAAGLTDDVPTLSLACPVVRTLWAVAGGTSPLAVEARLALDGQPFGEIQLASGALPPGVTAPAGTPFVGTFDGVAPSAGTLTVELAATDAGGVTSPPFVLARAVAASVPALIEDVRVVPNPVHLVRRRITLTISAGVRDDCGVRRVRGLLDAGGGLRRLGRLTDTGRRGDVVAGDGVYSRTRRRRVGDVTSVEVEIEATNRRREVTSSGPVLVTVQP